MTDMLRQLAEIPDLAVEVAQTVGVGAPNPETRVNIRHGKPSSKPPLDLTAWDLLRPDPLEGVTIGKGAAASHLIDRLGMCVRMVAEERELAGLPQPEPAYGTFAETCGYLAATASWWLDERGLAEDVGHEVGQVHHALARAARVPKPWRHKCRDCDGTVILADRNRQEVEPADAAFGLCLQCDRTYALGASMRALSEVGDPIPLHSIAPMLDVPLRTLHRWAEQGKITPVAERPATHRRRATGLYLVEDVRRAALGLSASA